jgi:hypothetical protein
MEAFITLSRERCIVCGVRVVAAICCDKCADAASWADDDEDLAGEEVRAEDVRLRRRAPREEAS